MILLIHSIGTFSNISPIEFKFQYDSINSPDLRDERLLQHLFKFQYDSINSIASSSDFLYFFVFKFQYDSINSPRCSSVNNFSGSI